METQEVIYYTCLNNHCPKHRNIFAEGDPQHANCDRERFYLQGQREPMPRAAILTGAAVGVATLGLAVVLLLRLRKPRKPQLPMIREESALDSQRSAVS
jgi:multisubunit Na+/H+ antiporter MnhC subunit